MADRRRPNIVLLAVIAIAVLALAAVLVGSRGGGGGDDDTSSPSRAPSSTATGGTTTEVGTVHVRGTALPELDESKDDPAIGMQAPVVSGTTFAGDAISTGTGPTLLVFVAHWCPHCQREVPRLVDWFGDGVPGGVALEGVATGIDQRRPNYPPSAWLTREHWTFPTLVDDASSSAARAYGLNGFPYFVGIDASGKVAVRRSGELDRAGVQKLLDAVSS